MFTIQPSVVLPSVGAVMTGRVIDSVTKEPIPRASISVVDDKGVYLGDGVSAGAEGNFLLNSPLLPGNSVSVSSVGYTTQFYPVASLMYDTVFELDPDYLVLDAVVVTPSANRGNAIWWLLGGAAALYYFTRKKKRNG